MAAKGTVEAVLDVARRNLGIAEGPNNDNPFAAIAGDANNEPWCASFVRACLVRGGQRRAGGPSPYTPAFSRDLVPVAKADVQPGDVGFLYFPSMGRIAHTFFIEQVYATYVLTIEGNTDEVGGRTGGKVMRKKRSYKNLTFGRPDYVEAAAPKPPPAKRKPDAVLRTGNQGQQVLNVQNALRKLGSRVKPTSIYDKATANAVISFQRREGLTADAVVGQATWDRLRVRLRELAATP